MATYRVSINSNGTQANSYNYSPSISGNGRYVAYYSGATNLVSGDNNGATDIFLYDTVTKNNTRVSVDSNGNQALNSSYLPSISGDGRYVAYQSDATNLVAGDSNTKSDIFVYDTVTKNNTRVSVHSNGNQATGDSESAAISGDGRYIAYTSEATNLVAGDTNGVRDIFLYDTVTKNTSRLSVDSNGNQAIDDYYIYGSDSPSISADGRYVAYSSFATNLVEGDTNNHRDIFVYDTVTKTNTRVSVDSNGNQASGAFYGSVAPSISSDGRYLAYQSDATNLVAGDTNDYTDIFVYDTVTKTNTRVSVDSNGNQGNNLSFSPSISSNGRYVAYQSYSTNLVRGDNNTFSDIFVFDTVTKKTSRVSVDSQGNPAYALTYTPFGSASPAISGDGKYVTYESYATNLVPGDTNNATDIFVSDNTHLAKDIITFSQVNFTVVEDRTPISAVTVTRSNPSNTSVTATLRLIEDTATRPDDYLVDRVLVSFAPGETLKTIAIPIVNDGFVEGNETVHLSLINPTDGSRKGDPQTAILTIIDNDWANRIHQIGTPSDDTIIGSNGKDIISGSSGNDSLSGGTGNDALYGNAGNDTLRGGGDLDYLSGGAGNDSFAFNSPTLGVDTIADFNVANDSIIVSATGFGGGLTVGTLSSSRFALGTGATTSSQRFIYNQTTGSLSFDVDGSGASLQQQLANLTPNLALTNSDIVVV